MSTSLAHKPLTFAQRAAAATQRVAEQQQLTDLKRLAAALAELAAEEVQRNPGFAVRLRGLYEDLAPQTKVATVRATKTAKAPAKPLTPIKRIVGFEIDPSAPLDPYFQLEIYGAEQLEAALRRHTKANLHEAAEIVQDRHPGTSPAGTSKDALLAYIIAHVRT
jgi:hypothetical protein